MIENTLKAVDVVNASSGEILTFCDMTPSDACILADLYSSGHTIDYLRLAPIMRPKLIWGKKTVAYGDWCAAYRQAK